LAAHARSASNPDQADERRKRIKLGGAILGLLAAGGITWFQLSRETPAEAASTRRMLQCASSGNVFPHDFEVGESQPFKCDICGKDDAYIPEKCYWSKGADGQWTIKDTPTYVILPYRLDQAGARSMDCPDCGRQIVGHNPKPAQEDVDRANGAAGANSSGTPGG